MSKISIIVPFYNEENSARNFCNSLFDSLNEIKNHIFEVIFINDGSTDNTLHILKQQINRIECLKILSFSRNFGHEAAINAGIDNCSGDAAIVMDADLQDPPQQIINLISKWERGYDVVNIKRINRNNDSCSKRLTAKLFYKLISHWAYKINIEENVNNFRLISKRVINIVKSLTSKNKVFRFEVPFAGFKTTDIEIDRPCRNAGKSHYHIAEMSRLAIDSIVSVSIQPLNLISKIFLVMCLLFCLSFTTEIVLYIIQKCNGVLMLSDMSYLAWLIVNCCLFFTLVLLLGISIIAQYIARIHLETQNRPTYVVDEIFSKK